MRGYPERLDWDKFYWWVRRAKDHAERSGFSTPVAWHEYQVLINFYLKGIPSHDAIRTLIAWREARR